jgi:A/G-specific adenine glycosylase
MAAAIIVWFEASHRPLPWRTDMTAGDGQRGGPMRNAYHALVAEAMLQQTQVSRVVEYLARFIERFPTVQALAAAQEAEVLAMWAGLGYYRRARLLHAAAKAIVEDHGGRVPETVEALRALPGVGAYTAGSIASIVFYQRAALVDGNVQRVVQRLEGDASTGKEATARAWARAEALVRAADESASGASGARSARFARLNEGLMELGALVCTPPPSTPACLHCPLGPSHADVCVAQQRGLVGQIPPPKAAAAVKALHAVTVVLLRAGSGGEGPSILLEQRPASGLWAGLWQAPTIEQAAKFSQRGQAIAADLCAMRGGDRATLRHITSVTHVLTHRRVQTEVYAAHAVACVRKTRRSSGGSGGSGGGGGSANVSDDSPRWVTLAEIEARAVGLSSAARKAIDAAMAAPRVNGAKGTDES